MDYDSIGKRLRMTADLSELSGRDKVNLFHELAQQLGVYDAIAASPVYKETAQIISDALGKHW